CNQRMAIRGSLVFSNEPDNAKDIVSYGTVHSLTDQKHFIAELGAQRLSGTDAQHDLTRLLGQHAPRFYLTSKSRDLNLTLRINAQQGYARCLFTQKSQRGRPHSGCDGNYGWVVDNGTNNRGWIFDRVVKGRRINVTLS